MLARPRFFPALAALLSALPGVALGQVIFTDGDFNSAAYTSSSAGTADIRFNFNYSSFDVFGDDYLNVSIPPAPRGGGTTTGAFVSANNNSLIASQASFASISPTGVNVGTGTGNPNYVMRVDVFHSTSVGIDNGGTLSQRGSTNHTFVGVNQANTTVQISNLNAPGATGGLTGQGLGLAITADSGDTDDYFPIFGGATYRDRTLTEVEGQAYSQPSGANSGLLSRKLNDYWVSEGFEFDAVDEDPNNNLNRFTGNHSFWSPDPTDTAGYLSDGSGVDRSLFLEAFPQHDDPLHYAFGANPPPGSILTGNTSVPGGVPYNQWATHELYWVDGTFTYVIDDVPVLQITPDNTNTFSPFSSAGTAVLGFWDRFGGSISLDPDGGNFVIYDNLEFAVASAGDVPDSQAYLTSNGFIGGSSLPGDLDGDGNVNGNDFLFWQRGGTTPPLDTAALAAWQGAYGNPATAALGAVPEPSSLVLLFGLAGCGLLRRRP